MPVKTEYQTVILAALLHDIGKLLGRGKFELIDKGQHPKFSSDFIGAFGNTFSLVSDVKQLRELVQKHHENTRAFSAEYLVSNIADDRTRVLGTIISKADKLSSSERGVSSDTYQDYKTTPLCSIIEQVEHQSATMPNLRFHPQPVASTASSLFREIMFPSSFAEYKSGEMNKLIEAFGSAFKKFTEDLQTAEFNTFFTHLNNILYAHTWCIPSDTQLQTPDVSLYDHLKTTAAIASCLYRYHEKTDSLSEKGISNSNDNRFIILAGDISGIQKFIFDIPSSSTKNVAKRLRARSLLVQLYTEVAVQMILDRLNFPLTNLIMNSGGNFYILLPNTDDIKTELEAFQKRLDTLFIKELNGELAINLAWYPFGDEGFGTAEKSDNAEGFSNVLFEVKTLLNRRKLERSAGYLRNTNKWQEPNFVIDHDYAHFSPCDWCKKYPAKNGEYCDKCQRENEIGKVLPKAGYIELFDNKNAGQLPILDYSASIGTLISDQRKPLITLQLNDISLEDITHVPANFKYAAIHVPQDNGDTLTFEQIAEKSAGDRLLGFLKADVDRLGELFVFGLKRKSGNIDSISRITTLSRMLDVFFSGWLESLVSTRYTNCYTVYSGGDDLFFVGPWNEILELAEQIRNDFMSYCGNPAITISAGVIFTRPDYPISKAAYMVENALTASKKQGRNRLTVQNSTLTWSEWEGVKKEWLLLRDSGEKVSSSILYSLLDFADMWQEYVNGDTMGLRYHPMLSYQISRNVNPRVTPVLFEWSNQLLIWPPDTEAVDILDNLRLIIELYILSTRGGR